MKIGNRLPVLAAAVLLVGMLVSPRAQSQSDAAAVAIGAKDIGGVVSSPQGREAGVWVIAETTELPTQFRRIVVTDDKGRYLVPDLPQADYSVWVRGYGLVNSPKMRAKPGQRLDLAAAPAPSAADAAHYYPAIYWYSLLKIPDKNQFGGENGIPANVTQQDWLVNTQEPRLRRLPSARPGMRRARSPPPSPTRRPASTPGCGACSRASRRRSWSTRSPGNWAARRSNISPTGPTASRKGELPQATAAAAARGRAQPRHHRMGLGHVRTSICTT